MARVVLWKVLNSTERDAIDVHESEIGNHVLVYADSAYYKAIKGGTGSAVWESAAGMQDLVDDTTPQLGGALDGNGKAISGVTTLATTAGITAGTTLVATTTVTAGTGVIATTGGVTATAGNIVATAGNISATVGSVAAATTVTAGTNLVATAGSVSAATTVTAGTNLVATAGSVSAATTVTAGTNVVATAGSVSAATTVTAGTGVTATTGGVTATAGNIVATAGNISATVGSMSAGTTVTAGTNLVATANTVTPKLNSYPVGTAVLALSDGANIATNAVDNNKFSVTLGGNRTLDNPTNLVLDGWYAWEITQDGTGTRTLAYGTTFRFRGGAPTLTAAAGSRDVIFGYYNGTHLIMDVWLDVKA